MKRLINLSLLITFLFCYLEWPPNNSMFVFQGEYEIFTNTKNWVSNFTHPLILLGLLAQLILIYAVINPKINTKLNHLGVAVLTPIVLLFFVVGLLSFNFKIMASTLPFLILVVYYVVQAKRKQLQ
ncbi:hypothetical protein [Flavobacterium sp.]|uniref:hypothetical protein n=1 Tax=Flavobacterium sp. TaxID=239 RepID=UPI002B4B9444|nr:hypothetical protein [Flavobacterium sp.]